MTTATLAHADAAARLRVAVARLTRHLRQTAPGELSLSQWSALVTIETQGPVRIGDLAEREGVSAATATRLVASLEELGLVGRESDVTDRRSWRVSLTAAGRAKLEWARRRRTERLAQRLSTLSPDDVRRLLDALPVLESLVEE
ncbi:MAG TPA: MarR family transcriptional regulator [Mycobacteriales bacterium]|nr:MarR family transcriptional regulator [Mycobacteriales bacterium]